MKYESFQYLYPPRPEHKISLKTLGNYDNGQYLASPKLNGSNGSLYIDPNGNWQLWNRHHEKITLYNDKIRFDKLKRGNGWMVLNGEYLNKSKRDANGQTFNHKFVIFDILVFESQILVGWTYEKRVELLETLYPCVNVRIKPTGTEYDPFLCQTDIDDIYKARNFTGDFVNISKDLMQPNPEIFKTEDDLQKYMYEGMVIKRRTAPLQPLFREGNNSDWQIKIRRETKNYRM